MKQLGRGSTIVGFLDNKFHFNILNNVDFGNKKVVFIVGTNGKTTITNTLNTIYKNNNAKVLSNLAGANLVSGIKTSIIMDLNSNLTLKSDVLLLEVDEKNVKLISKIIPPNDVILTNFFRDQLDRYFEVDLILKEVISTLEIYNPTLYVNGQDPLINRELERSKLNVIKFSLDETILGDSKNIKEIRYCNNCKQVLKYNYFHYAHIGDFYCSNCSFKVKGINYNFHFKDNILSLKNDNNIKLEFNKSIPLYLIINYCLILNYGLYNKVIDNQSLRILQSSTMPKGRNNYFEINDKKVYLTLAKNVVGMEQTINHITNNYKNIDLLIAFNDNYADSKDVSWIWDIDFQKLLPFISSLHIVGLRKGDMKLRFLYDGYDKNIFTYDNIGESIDNIITYSNPIIISNYTPLKEINAHINSLQNRQ